MSESFNWILELSNNIQDKKGKYTLNSKLPDEFISGWNHSLKELQAFLLKFIQSSETSEIKPKYRKRAEKTLKAMIVPGKHYILIVHNTYLFAVIN